MNVNSHKCSRTLRRLWGLLESDVMQSQVCRLQRGLHRGKPTDLLKSQSATGIHTCPKYPKVLTLLARQNFNVSKVHLAGTFGVIPSNIVSGETGLI